MQRLLSRTIFLIVCFALGIATTVYPATSQEDRAIKIAKLARASTVSIETDKGTGSGFVIADEYVATNYHVIEDASRVSVHLVGYRESLKGSVFKYDKDNDLAVLRVPGLEAPFLTLSRVRLPRQGSKVYVYGNPLNLEGTFSSGEVSALRGNRFIQITAPISPGSSGGPVLNERGFVIGVAQGQILDKERRSQNLNVAIPVFYLIELVKGRIELQDSASVDDDKEVRGPRTNSELPSYLTNTVWRTIGRNDDQYNKYYLLEGGVVRSEFYRGYKMIFTFTGLWSQSGNTLTIKMPRQAGNSDVRIDSSHTITGTVRGDMIVGKLESQDAAKTVQDPFIMQKIQ